MPQTMIITSTHQVISSGITNKYPLETKQVKKKLYCIAAWAFLKHVNQNATENSLVFPWSQTLEVL